MNPHDLNDDTLREAMHGLPIPPPSEDAKRRAMELALSEFDLAHEKTSQGSPEASRPKPMKATFLTSMGDWLMNWTLNRKALTAAFATTLCVVVVLAITPQWTDKVASKAPAPTRQLNEETPARKADLDDGRAASDGSPVSEGGKTLLGKGERAADAPAGQPREREEAPAAQAPQPFYQPAPEPMPYAPAAPYAATSPAPYDAKPSVVARGPQPTFTGSLAPQKPSAPGMMYKSQGMAGEQRGTHTGADEADALFERSLQPSAPAVERDRFAEFETSPLHLTKETPVSTFSVDVDTASYSFVRRMLNDGRFPQPHAVRVEEMINYFDYAYETPADRKTPFKPTVAIHPNPWNAKTRLLHVGIKGYALDQGRKPRSNLVFLIDVSGSMHSDDKLPLLKKSMALLVNQLAPEDTVAITVYAGAAGSVLEPTPVREKHKILAALERLTAGGSTAGGAGIELAYALAEANFDPKAVNRVILATDGDFNVGVVNDDALKGLITRKRESGIFLSVLGFGQGNLNDRLMQDLAQNGNGVAAYIDSLNEARKVLVEEASANLFPIAKDVKIQIEFNPAQVAEYRLIGYETRKLNREDFNNDKVDAGDIGAGHTVTALYEITLTDSEGRLVDDLRYGQQGETTKASGEYAFLKLRYKLPDGKESTLMTRPITTQDMAPELDKVSPDMRFAAAVAAFGQKLTGGRYLGDFGYDGIIALAQGAKGDDPYGHRAELVNLVRLAQSLDKR